MKKLFTTFLISFAFTLMFLANTHSQITTYSNLSDAMECFNFYIK